MLLLALAACGARTELDIPEAPPTPPTPCEGAPVLLVSHTTGPDAIAISPLRLYWAQWFFGGAVSFINASTVESQVLATDQPAVNAIAVRGETPYWVTVGWSERGGTLARGIFDGRDVPLLLANDLFQPGDLAVDDDTIYFLEGSNSGGAGDEGRGSISRIERDGAGRRVVAAGLGLPTAIAIDESHVYWVDSWRGLLGRVAKSGGDIEEVVSGLSSPGTLALDAGELFWADGGALRSARVDGTGLRVVAEGVIPSDLAVDSTHVYWTAAEGAHRAPRAGGPAELVHRSPAGRQITVDAERIYFTGGDDTEGYLLMLCKPP